MAAEVLGCSVNASLTPEEIEEIEHDVNVFMSSCIAEGSATINPGLASAPLQLQPAPHAQNPIPRGTKRKFSDDESSTTSVSATQGGFETAAAPAPKKRPRVKMSSAQSTILEGIFSQTHYVVGKQRRDLAAYLGLTDNQIGSWFEYRRRCVRQVQKRKDKKSACVQQQLVPSVWQPQHVDAVVQAASPQLPLVPTAQFQTNDSALLGCSNLPLTTWQSGYYDASAVAFAATTYPYSSCTSTTTTVRQDLRYPSDFGSPNSIASSSSGVSYASYGTYLWPEEVNDFLSELGLN